MTEATAPTATEKAAEKAASLNLDLSEIKGTGSEGRITVDDVDAHAAKVEKSETSASGGRPADLMPDRAHKEGCPADPNRVELYTARKPRVVEDDVVVKPARDVRMVHCVDCGETFQLDK